MRASGGRETCPTKMQKRIRGHVEKHENVLFHAQARLLGGKKEMGGEMKTPEGQRKKKKKGLLGPGSSAF